MARMILTFWGKTWLYGLRSGSVRQGWRERVLYKRVNVCNALILNLLAPLNFFSVHLYVY